jgi:putative Mn2+ efflux pump MntP
MIREAVFEKDECECCEVGASSMSFKEMFPMAIATSIDALAVGVTFALKGVEIFSSITLIGVTTFVLSAVGVGIGSFIGGKFRKVSSIAGGSVLILMGIKILLEGLGII